MARHPAALLTLILCLPALAANLTVLPEQRIAVPAAEPARTDQLSPALASRGQDALAVWSDSRSGSDATFATRLAADGTILDPTGILVNAGAGEKPDVAWNGRDYVVIAMEEWNSPTALPQLQSSLVAPDGSVSERVSLGNIERARIASNGREVALGGISFGTSPLFALLDNQGRFRKRTTLPGSNVTEVHPVADGTDWFVVSDGRDCDTCALTVKLHTLDSDGRVTKTATVMERPSQWHRASVTAAEGRFLLTWATFESNLVEFRGRVWYTVVDRDGRQLVPSTILENTQSTFDDHVLRWGSDGLDRPAVVWDGQQFVVLWKWYDGKGETALRSARVSLNGERLDSTPMTPWTLTTRHLVNGWTSPAAVKTESHLLVHWGAVLPIEPSSRRVALTQRVVTSAAELAQPGPTVEVTRSPSTQYTVGLAPGPEGVFVTWHEAGAKSHLHGRLFPYAGAPHAPVAISVESTSPGAYGAAARFGAGVFLVVWREDQLRSTGQPILGRVLMRRYDGAGRALDAAPVELASEGYKTFALPGMDIGLAFDGTNFLVTWAGVNDHLVHAKRVTPAGEIVDRLPLVLSNEPASRVGNPRPVWTGSEYAVVWYENPTPSSNGGAPLPILPHYGRFTRLSADGTVLEPAFPIVITTPPGFDIHRSPFDVATNGSELFVTWSYVYQNETTPRSCAFGQRFTLKGEPIDREPKQLLCHNAFAGFSSNGAPLPIWTGAEWQLIYQVFGTNRGIFTTPMRNGRPDGSVTTLASPAVGATAVQAPAGIWIAYTRPDTAYGNVYGAFLRRLGEARTRAVRH